MDPHKSDKSGSDPHQSDADPQQWLQGRYLCDRIGTLRSGMSNEDCAESVELMRKYIHGRSVADPGHSGVDPDPRIHAFD